MVGNIKTFYLIKCGANVYNGYTYSIPMCFVLLKTPRPTQ